MLQKSFEAHPDLYSYIQQRIQAPKTRNVFKSLIRDSFDFISRYFLILPRFDYWIAKLYYIDGLTQIQIGKLLGISQVAVSRRLKYILIRLKFILKTPSWDPIQVREEFKILFPEKLFETAYYLYWEYTQSRVRFFIRTSQLGVANKFTKIIEYLELVIKEDECTDIENSKEVYLASIYIEYFRFLKKKKNIINFLFKKNAEERNTLIIKEDICEDIYK
jgi:hypothetical protein